jgi:hypothetical protein
MFLLLAIQLLLGVLGLGVGLSVVNPAANATPDAGSLGLAGAVWWGVSYLIAAFFGGYAAARLAVMPNGWDGALHGLVTWAFALIVTVYLLSTAVGGLLGGAFSVVGGALSAGAQGIGRTAPQVAQAVGISPQSVEESAKQLLNPQPSNADPKNMSPEEAQKEIAANLPKLGAGGEQATQARQRITAIMAAQLNISADEANKRLDQMASRFEQKANQLTSEAKQAAGAAAGNLSQASLGAFGALLVGAICAALGGLAGTRRRVSEI